MADEKIKLTPAGWNALVKTVILEECVPRLQRVADACNDGLDDEWNPGYLVSTEGPHPLQKRDYRATCITANWGAIEHNARTNALVNNFHLAGGA